MSAVQGVDKGRQSRVVENASRYSVRIKQRRRSACRDFTAMTLANAGRRMRPSLSDDETLSFRWPLHGPWAHHIAACYLIGSQPTDSQPMEPGSVSAQGGRRRRSGIHELHELAAGR